MAPVGTPFNRIRNKIRYLLSRRPEVMHGEILCMDTTPDGLLVTEQAEHGTRTWQIIITELQISNPGPVDLRMLRPQPPGQEAS